jgi:hypothetical protein
MMRREQVDTKRENLRVESQVWKPDFILELGTHEALQRRLVFDQERGSLENGDLLLTKVG